MKIEQIAIATESIKQSEEIINNLKKIGLDEWVQDTVTAHGTVFDKNNVVNEGHRMPLSLRGFELEILTYLAGSCWHDRRHYSNDIPFPFLSHMGLHVDKENMRKMKAKMSIIGCSIAQEIYTISHTNPAINGKRKYHYVVFDSIDKLGFDLKLIERIMLEE